MRLTRIGSELAMATISALNETSLSELSPALERGDVSSREIVEQCLAAIQARDAKLHGAKFHCSHGLSPVTAVISSFAPWLRGLLKSHAHAAWLLGPLVR